MAYIIQLRNPFDPTDIVKHVVTPGISFRGWLKVQFPDFVEFDKPTVCNLNGKYILRKDWDTPLAETDILVYTSIPGYMWAVVALVIMVIVMTVLYATNPVPQVPGEAPASDPVYSLKGQQNEMRLGEPIEVCYGRNRVFPSLAARPYFQYVDNDQFQYTLLCLGHGYFEIHEIRIGDTPIASYQEVTYEVLPPYTPPTLFPTNVVTSAEAGGQMIIASNEDTYVPDGWIGPFASNPSNTTVTRIEIDLIFPKGLYSLNSSGDMDSVSFTVVVEYREIDDAGLPLSAFDELATETITGTTTTAQRQTLSYAVDSGRYELRLRRTDLKNLSYKAGHDVVWDGLRGFIEDAPHEFGLKTFIAVRIRATNNLNERTQLAFNVICTRKLPIYDTSGGLDPDAPVTTRSIVWAFVDCFSSYYGANVGANFFDWDGLLALDELLESRGDHFDWIFRDPITVWEAARAIALCGRSIPLLIGSLISMRRDTPQEIPVTMFTPDNIVANSFQWDIKLWDINENDSIRIEYTEVATDYKQETVLCTLPGGTNDRPKDIRFPGIQDRQHAYREGMYLLAKQTYQREAFTFDTGLEGHIPIYGDLIALAHDVPRWGQWGYVLHAEPQSEAGQYILYVSEPLRWDDTGSYVILLRDRYGATIGPLDATQMDDPRQVLISVRGHGVSDIDFLLGGETDPMFFTFGVSGNMSRYAMIVQLEPQGGETIRVGCIGDEPSIYSFDELIAPGLLQIPLPPKAPDLPEIARIYINQLDPALQIIQITWSAAFGAQYYLVQTSEDGVHWLERTTTTRTSIQMQARSGGIFHVRVAAVNVGQGPWKEASITLKRLLGLDIIHDIEDSSYWTVGWSPVIGVSLYRVRVYEITTSSTPVLLTSELVGAIEFTFDYLDAEAAGGPFRDYLVEVEAAPGGTADGNPVSLELHNTQVIGMIPTVMTFGTPTEEDGGATLRYPITLTLPDLPDLFRIKIWFLPAFSDPTVVDPSSEWTAEGGPGRDNLPSEVAVDVALDTTGGHPEMGAFCALFDCWGQEITSENLSLENIIPAYP